LESGGQGRSGHQALDAQAPFTFARRNLCETAMQRRRAQWKGDAHQAPDDLIYPDHLTPNKSLIQPVR